MAEAATAPPDDIITVESENARNEFAQVLKAKRAGPDASVVRKIVWFWSTLADLDLHGKDSYRVVAAARRLIEGALPAGSLAGFSPIQARRGMLRAIHRGHMCYSPRSYVLFAEVQVRLSSFGGHALHEVSAPRSVGLQ